MTTVTFHSLDTAEKERAVCRLAHHYYAAGRGVLILAASAEQAQTIDTLLWTFQQASFIPHRIWAGDAAGSEKVLIGTEEKRPEGCDVLVLGKPASPGFLKGFQEVADFAEKYDAAQLAFSRKRYKDCQAAGLKVKFLQRPHDPPELEEEAPAEAEIESP